MKIHYHNYYYPLKIIHPLTHFLPLSFPQMEEARQAILFEWEDHLFRAQPESLLMDLAHQAAYRNNTLGLPSISNHDRAREMTVSW